MTITLAQLEAETARRVGPYVETFSDRQVPSTAASTFAFFPELRSTIDLDSVTNLWALRRGQCWDPTTGLFDEIDDIPLADRQRLVAEYDPARGQVFVDRPWGTSLPEAGEWFEFHHLNPSMELRRAVQAGLRRCFIQDQLQVAPTSQYGAIDLTAQCPWLTDGQQVQRVQYGWATAVADAPFDTVTSGGHVYLTGTTGPYAPVTLWLTAMRPAWSWVNGADSTGPTDDWDELEVDLDYAAAAGHIEAWHLFPARLQAAAAGGIQATQEMAAREFTRQSLIHFPVRQTQVAFKEVTGLSSVGPPSWVNL